MMNVKHGLKNYLSLILSLAFTVLILFNFQNLIGSDSFLVLGTRNKEYIEIIVQIISFILGCFMFFMEIVNGMASESGMAENILLFVVTGMVGLNFLVELAINLVISSAVVFIIGIVKKRTKIY